MFSWPQTRVLHQFNNVGGPAVRRKERCEAIAQPLVAKRDADGAPYVTAGDDLDVVHDRRVHGEGALHADTEADLARGERFPYAATLTTDDDALEHLDPLTVALDDPHVDLHGVTRAEVRDVAAQRGSVDRVEGVHDQFLR